MAIPKLRTTTSTHFQMSTARIASVRPLGASSALRLRFQSSRVSEAVLTIVGNWPGWFPLPGNEETFHNNACILDAGQNYITLPTGRGWGGISGKGCEWSKAESIAIHVHDNKIFAPAGDALVSGCSGPSLPSAASSASGADEWDQLANPTNPGSAKYCVVYNDTDCSDGDDLCHGPPGLACPGVQTMEACVAECAKNCACAAGVWGRTGANEHECYIKAKPAHHTSIGAYKGNTAFTCTPTCKLPPAPTSGPIKFAEWSKIGIDPGSTIADVPKTSAIISMGVAVLTAGLEGTPDLL